jgi:hypothetical protein
MTDKSHERIIGVDHIDGDRAVVEYADGTSAIYTVGDLAALPNERVKPGVPITEGHEPHLLRASPADGTQP